MDTSASFLDALQSASNEDAWRTLDEAYGPLIRGWLQRQGADWADTDDVVQEVMLVVARRFGDFHRQRTGAFRSWLKTIAVNCLRDHWRRQKRTPKAPGGSDFGEMLAQLEDPHSGISKQWDREHDRHVTEYLLRQ
ncbi:MAG: sigma-70 family RNA polymerase sigma factor, partial [Pirellulaceae bacterium]|nr:sigma-70 family RNA polymerase sigma factor [Pirellulaceae bacterium]